MPNNTNCYILNDILIIFLVFYSILITMLIFYCLVISIMFIIEKNKIEDRTLHDALNSSNTINDLDEYDNSNINKNIQYNITT